MIQPEEEYINPSSVIQTEESKHFIDIVTNICSEYQDDTFCGMLLSGLVACVYRLYVLELNRPLPSFLNTADIEESFRRLLIKLSDDENIQDIRNFILSKTISYMVELSFKANQLDQIQYNMLLSNRNIIVQPGMYDFNCVPYDTLTESTVRREIELPCECCICSENEFNCDSMVTELECGHVFHNSCIRDWTETKPQGDATCPICRNKIKHTDPIYFHLLFEPYIVFSNESNFNDSEDSDIEDYYSSIE